MMICPRTRTRTGYLPTRASFRSYQYSHEYEYTYATMRSSGTVLVRPRILQRARDEVSPYILRTTTGTKFCPEARGGPPRACGHVIASARAAGARDHKCSSIIGSFGSKITPSTVHCLS
eukprot:scaffold52609_cov47-Prasinocladus_malaysianus.AAC.2